MRILIVEDEFAAQANLRNLLTSRYNDVEILETLDSVAGAVNWLHHNDVDVIFMDVELSDGTCFEIFKRIDITAKVIITTAYDDYAIRAFRVNSVDYLLKPIDPIQLDEAIAKCRHTEIANPEKVSHNAQLLHMYNTESDTPAYKQRFVVQMGDKYLIVKANEIAYFYSKDKQTFFVTFDGRQYVINSSLDMVESTTDPAVFFRVNRAYITNVNAIKVIFTHFSGRLKLSLTPTHDEEVFVSRVRVTDFKHWINQ